MLRLTPLLALALVACKDQNADTATPLAYGDGLFAEGCPPTNQAVARQIGVDASLPGRTAVGGEGDWLIANEHAAYVITRPDSNSTYYYYGGVLADAAALSGCAPATDDKVDEVAFVIGELDLADVNYSTVRAFRGESAEVINDGSNGEPAILRVTGTDDTHWLVEYELIARAASDGGRPFSDPFGLDLTVDYILSPDSPVLEIELTVDNPTDEDQTVFWATLLSFHEGLDLYAYASDVLSTSAISLDYGIPWMVATDGDGAWAYAVEAGNLAWTRISGMDIAADFSHILTDPADLAANVGTHTRSVFFSVGATDGPSATAPLAAVNPEPLQDQTYALQTVSGRLTDALGEPVVGARITLEADSGAGWGGMDETVSGAHGAFSIPVPAFEQPWSWQLVARGDGRDDGEAVAVLPGDAGVQLAVGAPGALEYAITDADGADSPARLYLERDDGAVFDRWLVASGSTPLPPGEYTWTATRGYEFGSVTGAVTIPEGGAGEIAPVMERLLDTTGFLSSDTHVHTAYSPDGRISAEDQVTHAAAHGLEVMLNTEHEIIIDLGGLPGELGLSDWVAVPTGEEVTATLPEHMTMFPAVPDGTPRGGIVEWYGMDIDQLFSAMYERSEGGINIFNHPGYMDLVGWDRVLAQPTMDDPTLLGLPAGGAIWSWQFDGIEVMNGNKSPFMDNNGRFDNWQSLVNAGYPISAVGCSDDHGGDEVGFPLTWFASTTDDPADFRQEDMTDAFRSGQIMASTGAFARVAIGDAGLGDLVVDAGPIVDLDLHVEAIPEIDVTHAVVFVNCDEVLVVGADDPDGVIKLSDTLSVPVDIAGDSQIVVAAFGAGYLPLGLPQFDPTYTPRVLTNPIYVDGDGDGAFSAPGGRECSYSLSWAD